MPHNLKIAAALFCTVVLLITVCACGKKSKPADETKFTVSEGDGKFDPENVESNDTGSHVSAADLYHEKGKANGIDVSKWQGKIDWKSVAESGIDFAIIRVGYRGENGTIYRDANADYNIQQALQHGIMVGVYFFSTAVTEAEASAEAEFIIRAVAGYEISYPVVYDCEGFANSGSRMYNLTAAQRTDNALTFLKAVSAAGYGAMFYASRNELEVSWETQRIESVARIWLAHYTSPAYPQKKNPDYSGKYDMWQYTNMGTVPGVEGNADMAVSYFVPEKAKAKDASLRPETAPAPQTPEESIYNTVTDSVTAKELVNLRKGASTKTAVVTQLQNGTFLQRTGIGSNGWSRLIFNGQTVYAITSYLTTDSSYIPPTIPQADIVAGNTFTAANDRVTAKEEVNLRVLPTTDSEIAGTLKNGTFLDRTAKSDMGWSRLIFNGQTVYAITSYLTTDSSYIPPTTPQADIVAGNTFTAANDRVTAKEEVNLRALPTTDSEIIGTLKNGTFLDRTAKSDKGWSRIIFNGQTVYAVTNYLTTEGS